MADGSINIYAKKRLSDLEDEADGSTTNPRTGRKMYGLGRKRRRARQEDLDIDGRPLNPYSSKPKTSR